MIKNGKDDALFRAILDDDRAAVSRLRERGVTLTDDVKYALTHSAGTLVKPTEYSTIQWSFQGTIQQALMDGQLDYFVSVLRNMREAVGEPLFFSNSAIWGCTDTFYDRAAFECILDCFDNRKINKKQNMLYIIDNDRLDILVIAAEHGWLKQPKKRDEMIEYAEGRGRTEIVAYLLDYQNRTVDAAAERAKAEKRAERELNAAPDSVTALKQLWNYKKQEDGTLIIKRYKGSATEITVPARIGKDAVTAVGVDTHKWGTPIRCFVPPELKNSVTKITLPDSVRTIGEFTFYEFEGLEEINIPDGVSEIKDGTFYKCTNLKSITLPESVVKIGYNAFVSCRALEKITLPKSVAVIGDRAFGNCTALKEITIPHGVETIGENTFIYCALKKVTLPDSLVKIDERAFSHCDMLEEIVVPEGVLEIGRHAFCECKELKTVVLPRSLTKIVNKTEKGKKPQHIFHGSENVTVTVEPKSYAEKYCRKNKINYVCKENRNE